MLRNHPYSFAVAAAQTPLGKNAARSLRGRLGLCAGLAIGLSSLFGAKSAAAEPELKPSQEEAKADFDEEMAPVLKNANEKCGTKIVLKSDYSHFVKANWAGYAHYSYCKPVLDAIASLCERPAYKKVMAKKINTVSCVFAGDKPPKKIAEALKIEGGTITFILDKTLGSSASSISPFIEEALDQ
ncbi:MAG: hypothetical protein H6729_02010 [Deltaproteobacteria bacterium]|nr:hypothetical protein [Deltaproteobacteria bacterium]